MFKLIKESLGLKFSFWLSLVLIMIFGTISIFNVFYQTRLIKARESESAAALVATILGAMRFPMLNGEQELIQKQLQMIKEANPLLVIHLLDEEGIIKRSTETALLGQRSEAEDLKRALDGKEIRQVELRKKVGYRVYSELKPIFNEQSCFLCHGSQKKVLGILRIAHDFRPVEKALTQNRNINIIFSISGLIIAIMVLYFLTKITLKPVNMLVNIAKEVATGNLSRKIDVQSEDEIGMVANSFNSIIIAFGNVAAEVRSASDKVLNSAQHFAATTQQMNASSQEVASTMAQMSKGVSAYTQRIEETYRIMEGMVSSLKEVVTQAEKTVSSSEFASQQVNLSGKRMIEMTAKMNKINETVTSAVNLIKNLGERSKQIGEITETITSIADQTNLLSLNAAIEAARAGDAGRGFAVVAEEVRKLAENSAQAANRIGGLIKNIQLEMNKTISAIETGSAEVIEGRQISNLISGVLDGVISAISEATKMAKNIAQAISGQLASSEKVIKAVDIMASVAKETSDAVEQTSSSVEEQSASVEEVASSSQELAQVASTLKEMVSKFKT